ncbi:SDR family oxidoreductase [Rhodocaloribacter litoris]|uniref:SDR family NAD(P)-dependent oxidoreductase n=1 Tax=Rhodocaloribacter litoris TaxID=2558931 RepID=UPI001422F128|nr:SDR family oxidoreductase [Rhodocaloribacter litoris]QXD14396.1 SDR family oxidoreductase [Rhodocaloribacter litoris]
MLENRLIVVTGAGGRLGRRMVQDFARHGATVAAVLRREAAAPSVPQEDGVHLFFADATEEAAVEEVFGAIARQCGPPDALVHTVGGWEARPFLETTAAQWDAMLRVNLTSAFLCFRAAARVMQAGGRGGRLIGIAAGQGADRGAAEQAAYSAAKAGVIRLVEAVAAEFAGTGLTAHAIAPSMILYDEDGDKGVRAADLVALCRYLCTDAGAALNGATLRAYG